MNIREVMLEAIAKQKIYVQFEDEKSGTRKGYIIGYDKKTGMLQVEMKAGYYLDVDEENVTQIGPDMNKMSPIKFGADKRPIFKL